eukprot:TRINITY_DN2599_c0_g1_i2.p1 TRINITY_DN2599_c0_g1~~TRINITY_DN2599_c0_g1_i2.p1  ORF type:complete len:275 (+),score=45.89 TRINITY_DN2599_c0_g1_i2:111-935(+)
MPSDIPKDLYDTEKLFARKDEPAWSLRSRFIVSAVGIASKLWMSCFTRTHVYGRDVLLKALESRPEGTPLITVTNHHSCMDEPLLWGFLDLRHLTNAKLMRWALAAHDICFSKPLHAGFFAYGKSIPVVRGAGVYQEGMNFTLEQLRQGSWVHLYPEGRVNLDPSRDLRLKWGVGRLLSELRPLEPIVIPIYHLGMDRVLPSRGKPYIPRPFNDVTIVVGSPIATKGLLKKIKDLGLSEEDGRKLITDRIQEELRSLRIEAEIWHAKHKYKRRS